MGSNYLRNFGMEGILVLTAFVMTAIACARRREMGFAILLAAMGAALVAQAVTAHVMTRAYLLRPPQELLDLIHLCQHRLFPPLVALAALLLALKKRPDKAPATPTAIMPPAAQEPRQP